MRAFLAWARPASVLVAVCLAGMLSGHAGAQDQPVWTVPEVGALPRDAHGMEVRQGRDLVTATYALIGPNIPNVANRYAGNNLACTNCHLSAGTRRYGLPLFGIYQDFPQHSARSGTEITIEERINFCMTRSMNGRPLPVDGPEMKKFVSYVRFLATGVEPGQKLPGHGAGNMPELQRAADPARGRPIYDRVCAGCHRRDGSGVRRSIPSSDLGYMMPPLWGPDSFNDGAGMARITNFANFIHYNMPHGADYLNPQLSVEDAWDIAAYALSQPRPHLAGLERDFPDLLTKPVDAPYGPYADGFTEQQHKYGPFGPIRAEIERLKRERAAQPR